MRELIEVHDLKGKLLEVKPRDTYYYEAREEYAAKGKITTQVKSIRLLLLNSAGRVYLQKRSSIKDDNPGLYDKTIGGHVPSGYTWEMAVIKECSEELGFPAAVLHIGKFYEATQSIDLTIVGLFREVDYISNYQSERVDRKGAKHIQPFMTTFYVGYYDGPIRFVDGESSGIEVFSMDELKKEIKLRPKKFTEDLKFMIDKYEKYLIPVK